VRPLDGEEGKVLRHVADVRASDLPLLEPGVVGLAVRGVHDEEVEALPEPVDDEIVDDPAPVVREERVLRLADGEPVEVVRERALEELARVRSFDFELAHVRDVEDAGVGPHRAMLRDDALVLHGHLPACERHHARSELDVPIVERRVLERLGHRHGRS